MDFDKVQKTYPRTVHALVEFVKQQHLNHMQKLREELGMEVVDPGVDEAMVQKIVRMSIEYNPVALFNGFDANDVKIVIMPHPEDNTLWLYYNSVNKASKTASSRDEANEKAVEEAFELVESKLNV